MELWSEAFGAGPDVLFVHGLGDSRLWEPVARLWPKSSAASSTTRGTSAARPAPQREIEHEVARRIPGARLVTFASDHYLTVREPERVAALLREFLTAAS